MSHGDPKNPKKNPHPVQRYEVIATADAPGSWDSVKGHISYDVVNPECTPEDKFLGVHALPQDVGHDIEMTRADERTWKGYFYRDFVQDEDYYGLGLCHWDVTQASPVFTSHGSNFVPGSGIENVKPYVEFFKKSDFLNHSLTDVGYGTTPTDPEIALHPSAFFAITVTVKEAMP